MNEYINFTFPCGKAIPNQDIIRNNRGVTFRSYGTLICHIPSDKRRKIVVTSYWNYSRTTKKYLDRFLDMYGRATFRTKEFQKQIDDKKILLQKYDKFTKFVWR